jgi:hypothetical protein
MKLSKEMKEILAGFYAAMNRYEEAFEAGDREASIRYGEQVCEYCAKYRKELNFTDEYIAEMRESALKFKEAVGRELISAAELKEAQREKAKAERAYYEALRKDEANGKKIKWN